MKMMQALCATIIVACSISNASAAKYNLNMVDGGNHWTISAYDDSTDDHSHLADIGVCFFKDGTNGSEVHYTWASDTYLGFGGRAAQEGDQVKTLGGETAAEPSYMDSMFFEIVTASPTNLATGHWQEWQPTSLGLSLPTNIVYATLSMVRDGPCPYATISDLLNATAPLRSQMQGNRGPINIGIQ